VVVMVASERFCQLEASELIVGCELLDGSGLYEHCQISVSRRLRRVWQRRKEFGKREWFAGFGKRPNEFSATVGVSLPDSTQPISNEDMNQFASSHPLTIRHGGCFR
jgi:hypothetical protein